FPSRALRCRRRRCRLCSPEKTSKNSYQSALEKEIRYHKQSGPELLQLDDIQVGEPGQGQVRIKHTAIGVNYVGVYQRSGLYPMQLPGIAGNEGAGVVDAVGPGVKGLKKGD